MAISVAPLTTTVMNSVDRSFAGAASGINNAASRVAALLAVALFGLIMTPIFNRDLHGNLDRAGLSPAVIEAVEKQRNRLAAIEMPAAMDARETALARPGDRRGVRNRVQMDYADFSGARVGERCERLAVDRKRESTRSAKRTIVSYRAGITESGVRQ